MLNNLKHRFLSAFSSQVHIAPLVIFRIVFGAIMFISTVRFFLKGWIAEFYILPKFHFTFYGFDWVHPLGAAGMYAVFAIIALAALFIMLGLYYRIAIATFFFSFLYVELLDKTYYLNHYYVISIITFLLMFVPAQRYFSLDVVRKPETEINYVPAWTINIFKAQLFIIYFYAGISKLTYDWLFEAMPLKIWLPVNSDFPVIGPLLEQKWIAYFFSWFGAAYDLSIGFLLLYAPTRRFAYITALAFHLVTGWLFKIGMFPYIMILMTLIFFSEDFHRKVTGILKSFLPAAKKYGSGPLRSKVFKISAFRRYGIYCILFIYFLLQIILPFRYLCYPGKLYWTEEGYRFSWRVMLMEKGGTAFFYVQDPATGKKNEVINTQYLTPLQEKMMVTQPDMILQYAHFIDKEYRKKGINDPIVTVESYVTLNGSGSRPFINSNVDLSKEEESLAPKTWILPFHQNASQE